MRTVDFSTYIVSYNLVIGVLLILSSGKISSLAGALSAGLRPRIEKYTGIAVKTFGGSVAALSAAVLVVFHLLRLGVD